MGRLRAAMVFRRTKQPGSSQAPRPAFLNPGPRFPARSHASARRRASAAARASLATRAASGSPSLLCDAPLQHVTEDRIVAQPHFVGPRIGGGSPGIGLSRPPDRQAFSHPQARFSRACHDAKHPRVLCRLLLFLRPASGPFPKLMHGQMIPRPAWPGISRDSRDGCEDLLPGLRSRRCSRLRHRSTLPYPPGQALRLRGEKVPRFAARDNQNISPLQILPYTLASPLLVRDRIAHRSFSGAADGPESKVPEARNSASPERSTQGASPCEMLLRWKPATAGRQEWTSRVS